MIKQMIAAMIIFCGLSYAMEEDEANKNARQTALSELTELHPNPYKRTCGSHLLGCLYQLGNILATASQLRTSTIYSDLLALDDRVKNSQEQIAGVPFFQAFIANADTDMLKKEIFLQFKKQKGFYFLRGFRSLDGTPVFVAALSEGITKINLKKLADKIREHSTSQNPPFNSYANQQGSFLSGILPRTIDNYNHEQLNTALKQWLSEKQA